MTLIIGGRRNLSLGTKKTIEMEVQKGEPRNISYYEFSKAERAKIRKMKQRFKGTIYVAAFARYDEKTIKSIKKSLGLPGADLQVLDHNELYQKISEGKIQKDERVIMIYAPTQSGPEVELLKGSMFHALVNSAQESRVPHLMLFHATGVDALDIPAYFRSSELGEGNHYFVSYPNDNYKKIERARIETTLSESALVEFLFKS